MTQFSMTVDIPRRDTVIITTFDYRNTAASEAIDALIRLDLRPFGTAATVEQVRAVPGVRPLVDATVAAVLAYLDAPWTPDDPEDWSDVPDPVEVAIGSAGDLPRAVVGDLVATVLSEEHGVALMLCHQNMDSDLLDQVRPER